MAVIAGPSIDWGGDEPQSQSVIVDADDIAPSAPTFTANVLAAPAGSQLDPTTGVESRTVGFAIP